MTEETTKRYPRSDAEAFKLTHDDGVEGPYERSSADWQDKVVLLGCVATVVAALVFALWGWLS